MKLKFKEKYKIDNPHRRIMRDRIYHRVEAENLDDPRDIIEATITVCADYFSEQGLNMAEPFTKKLMKSLKDGEYQELL